MLPYIVPVLVLASGSPRRRELLSAVGLPFTVAPTNVDEETIMRGHNTPQAKAIILARAKAEAAPAAFGAFVVAADTLVVLEGQVLGKPTSRDDAVRMLKELRGIPHNVITGVTVMARDEHGETVADAETTHVWMRPYTDREIQDYVATGDPMDKAGAYAIQNPGFRPAERIRGCYWNVVGLPLCLLNRLLRSMAVQLTPTPKNPASGRCSVCVVGGLLPAPELNQPATDEEKP